MVPDPAPLLLPIMTRTQALDLLGGVTQAAMLIGVSKAAISQWPKVLTPRLRDRVYAVLWRAHAERAQRTVAFAANPPPLRRTNEYVPGKR